MRIYPSAYPTDKPPVDCRIDERLLAERRSKRCTPARCSNSKLTGKQAPPHARQPASQPQASDNSMYERMLMFMMDRNMPGLADASTTSGRRQGLLAIKDGAMDDTPPPDPPTAGCLQKGSLEAMRAEIDGSLGLAGGEGQDGGQERRPAAKQVAKRPAAAAKCPAAAHASDSDEKKVPVVRKRPAASLDSDVTCSIAKVRRIIGEGKSIFKNPDAVNTLRGLPAKAGRPLLKDTPIEYAGGRIYYVEKSSILRVYRRIGDRVEQTIPIDMSCPSNKKKQFHLACAIIENDPR